MIRHILLGATALGVAVLAVPGGLTRSQPAAPATRALAAHPRIFLDPATLTTLRSQAKANSPEWVALRARCENLLTGSVEWPDGEAYPESNSIGPGYQGSGYFPGLLGIGLCYQMALTVAPARAPVYAAKGVDILHKMSEPSGPHAPNVLYDSVYGIRFYAVTMALGFDWLFPALSTSERSRLIAALHRWTTAFEQSGFERSFPQGNYYAGYYNAKALAALAVEGHDPQGAALWSSWLNTVHGTLVQPYYAANLSGGGWPEGWNYGPFGVLNMSWPVLAAKTAKGLDLIHASGKPYLYPVNSARFLVHFSWPDLKSMEDSDFLYASDNPSPTHRWLVTVEAGLLSRFGDSFAKAFHSYARAVRATRPGGEFDVNWDPAVNFLFWDNGAPETDYRALPRSYKAAGMEMAAMRSAWSPTAVWGAFTAGPYTNYQENGEELFDRGSLAIVNGAKPFLVNAWGALVRNTPGTSDGDPLWQQAYDNTHDGDGPRDLFNVFYVDRPEPPGQGNRLRADGARTRIDRFEDAGAYVEARGSYLADMYPRRTDSTKTVSAWTREVVYLRPKLFVVFDRTQVTDPSIDQRMDFNFRGPLVARGGGRFDVGSSTAYRGTVSALLPAARKTAVTDVFGAHKVYRLSVRPPSPAATVRWATVLDAASSPTQAGPASALSVQGGMGVFLSQGSARFAVVQGPAPLTYTVPGTVKATNTVVGLQPGAAYKVTITGAGPWTVNVESGGTRVASKAGVLRFAIP